MLQICYNCASQFIFAGSRDRCLYGWKWPAVAGEESGVEPMERAPEPNTVLHGHSLGVTALDTSNGEASCVIVCKHYEGLSFIQNIPNCYAQAPGIIPFAFGIWMLANQFRPCMPLVMLSQTLIGYQRRKMWFKLVKTRPCVSGILLAAVQCSTSKLGMTSRY
jgi:hypothetical protein